MTKFEVVAVFELFLLSVLFVCAAAVLIDLAAYLIKQPPKSSALSPFMWFVGGCCGVVLLFWYANGMRFL